jgi:capsular polysaccharide biosynthesis protein
LAQGECIRVKRLIVPNFVSEYEAVDSVQLRWLKGNILNAIGAQTAPGSSSGDRLLILRKHGDDRAFANESELIMHLKPRGFAPYYLEDIPFAEQVHLFAHAKTVIAAHGSGLTNMLFADNLSVIELFGDMIRPWFYQMAKALGHRYAQICGTQTPTGISVPIDLLESALTALEL